MAKPWSWIGHRSWCLTVAMAAVEYHDLFRDTGSGRFERTCHAPRGVKAAREWVAVVDHGLGVGDHGSRAVSV
jgi:hypothetical protein